MKHPLPFSTESTRWEAVTQRSPQADGLFVYGVSTTGIYCRPVCPSHLPKRENVEFFDTWQGAEQAGFRPCKRCTPQSPDEADESVKLVIRACQIIEEAEQPLTLQQLADAVGLSQYHFQRLFKRIVGITPKQYAAEKRLGRVRAQLQEGATVTDAIYHAGFVSNSRFYEIATSSLGMRPKEYRSGGQGVSIHYAIVQSYLGWVLVAATDQGICRIDFGDTPEALHARLETSFPQADLLADDPDFPKIVAQVLGFLEKPKRGLRLPLDIQGTAFQRRVWNALQAIPAGTTASYGEIATNLGNPKAARAVARACGSNNIAVAIPCHRVVRSDGGLGGYRWGVERKRALLERESEER
ncbi:MAG: 6-O-methylguanine DNA methyltransferase [Chloroflexi bacterium RBG_13_56_8]|nr:MAG: 6-O-methylguanine DNA methyltransferase [Chloroflexi bacterium RBG_13_56_8]